MEHILGKEWTIASAGGSTGEAYYAQREKKRLFLKRNSSPFIAVLSAQGIVPKLVWTKRLENGDVITAQQWLEGRELTPEEMKHPKVAKLLSKIHHSSELLDMLLRIDKKPLQPDQLYSNLKNRLRTDFYPIELHQSLKYLERQLPFIDINTKVVCHCDMNHNNWLLSNSGQLYLIDWDSAKVGDPAIDIGMILYWYIPENEWDEWLECYGISQNGNLLTRMYWYLILEIARYYVWHREREECKEAEQRVHELRRLLSKNL
ncbi:phosphotransferase family protein [Aquibacillus albus]|uniref:Thiamine kinase-like enzyme n=1 Tax=Aquibacillus albus TaxID=1168171 RepID=A0ABS2N3Z4_9BACI|nr:phosphotransferase family protein [Aquibacillus albus]MBM7572823.1 thiamine kinase-like enzyme [Aquibacillus albus]